MLTFDAFSFIQVTFLLFIFVGLGSALMADASAPVMPITRTPRAPRSLTGGASSRARLSGAGRARRRPMASPALRGKQADALLPSQVCAGGGSAKRGSRDSAASRVAPDHPERCRVTCAPARANGATRYQDR